MSNFATQFAIEMIDALITSKTRVKLLTKFFLNSHARAYLRGLESEFGESSNAIRLELNRFEKAGLINSAMDGNKKVFQANRKHPLFKDIHNILLKHLGLDQIIHRVVDGLGDIKKVYLTGDYAHGTAGEVIDLIFVGNAIDKEFLVKLIDKAEKMIKRKLRYLTFTEEEAGNYLNGKNSEDYLLLWQQG